VEMLEPWKGRVYDPCCGSGGMFVQSEKFIEDHSDNQNVDEAKRQISIYGQERNHTTWRLCKMNLAVRGIDADIKWNNEGSFIRDEHSNLKFDYCLANPPFNVADWWRESLAEDIRWTHFGTPPQGNANYAWLSHIFHHLAPRGTAGVVLANGSMSSQQSGEGEMRKRMVEQDAVDCMVALPGQLFYSTQIPACLWFLARDKSANGHRDRRGEILFIDARKLGVMVDRTRREFRPEDVARITDTYHRWRGKEGGYEDVPGFCKSASKDEVAKHGYVLTPGRFVGAEDAEDDGVLFEERVSSLTSKLFEQFAAARNQEAIIRTKLSRLASNE
jgi:type I restriction enzyme M protein